MESFLLAMSLSAVAGATFWEVLRSCQERKPLIGFAAMPPKQRREIAAKGGRSRRKK